MTTKRLIAITGGIGSGKSMVARILSNMGHDVYDCDHRAKLLMTTSPVIRQQLTEHFGKDIYNHDGSSNKSLLSSIIFNDPKALTAVNGIVHPVVKDDLINWHNTRPGCQNFVETAILVEAGMHTMVDEVWNVSAPLETRIARVISRNATTRDKVLERINSQSASMSAVTVPVKNIINDGNMAILPQIMALLRS